MVYYYMIFVNYNLTCQRKLVWGKDFDGDVWLPACYKCQFKKVSFEGLHVTVKKMDFKKRNMKVKLTKKIEEQLLKVNLKSR